VGRRGHPSQTLHSIPKYLSRFAGKLASQDRRQGAVVQYEACSELRLSADDVLVQLSVLNVFTLGPDSSFATRMLRQYVAS